MQGILDGLRVDGTINDEEYRTVLERFGRTSDINEQTINKAVEGVNNSDYVASVIRKQYLQQNIGPAPEPKPVVPIGQPAISANLESEVNSISAVYPTVDPNLQGVTISDKLAEAALAQVIFELVNEKKEDK